MKGKLVKEASGWVIHSMDSFNANWDIYPLHPDSVKEIEEDSLIFDNIEARIAAYPEIEFEIIEIDNGAMSYTEAYQSTKYARII